MPFYEEQNTSANQNMTTWHLNELIHSCDHILTIFISAKMAFRSSWPTPPPRWTDIVIVMHCVACMCLVCPQIRIAWHACVWCVHKYALHGMHVYCVSTYQHVKSCKVLQYATQDLNCKKYHWNNDELRDLRIIFLFLSVLRLITLSCKNPRWYIYCVQYITLLVSFSVQ